jgi:hypothetical protein
MDASGFIILVVGAAALGLIGQRLIPGARYPYEWVVSGIGALVGGYAASERLGSAGQGGPELGGLFLAPALIGGIVLGGAVWLVMRNLVTTPSGRAT